MRLQDINRARLTTGLLILAGLVAWILLGPGKHERKLPGASGGDLERAVLEHEQDPEARAPVALEALDLDSESARKGSVFYQPEPDTLVGIRGRVVDDASGLPIHGIELSFLSKRPRTVTTRTDEHGNFETGLELSSGLVTALHLPDPAHQRFGARWNVEPGQFLLAPEGPPMREMTIRVRAPERVLEVDVRAMDGTPAALSSVSLSRGTRGVDGRFELSSRDFELADDKGRARFALYGESEPGSALELLAESGGVDVSDPLQLVEPLALKPWRLDLYTGGRLQVSCQNDRGEPLSGISLWLECSESWRAPRGRAAFTDARGMAQFAPLPAGCWMLRAVHPQTGERIERDFELTRAAERSLTLRMSVANLLLGASGMVVDDAGHPLPRARLAVRNGDAPLVEIETREDGRFEFYGMPSSGLMIRPGLALLDPQLIPDRLELPFGTHGIVLRQVGDPEPLSLAMRLVDAKSLAAVRGGLVELACGPERANAQRFQAPDGVTSISFLRGKSHRYTAEAVGYRQVQGVLQELLETQRGGIATIALQPGFERTIRASDRITRRPLVGAVVWMGSTSLGQTDSNGELKLALESWPAQLMVEAKGYSISAWSPKVNAEAIEELYLEPAGNR